MSYLEDRVVIVTGAGRGIGAAISKYFSHQGAKLVLNDLGADPTGQGGDAGPVDAVAAQINDNKGYAVADGGDVADTATGRRLVDLALKNYGRLDAVVNVAGILRDRMIFNLPEEDWDAVIRVHLRGHFSVIKPAAAYWREQRNPEGKYRIVNFTSDSALQASPGQPNYAAAKMGVVGLTGSLANALAKYGVTSNAIAPGAATRLTNAVPDDKKVDSNAADEQRSSPDNIAPIAAYLAGSDSDWLSGRVIGANGYQVKLWNTPQVLETVTSSGPWKIEDLASRVEDNFRPLADGLPPSVFQKQF